ncbi:MAG: hypothetical protein UR26_C0008G0001, partial [candidate division TM6 bacterium GW2011_GWF2_32_72]
GIFYYCFYTARSNYYKKLNFKKYYPHLLSTYPKNQKTIAIINLYLSVLLLKENVNIINNKNGG